MEVESYSLGIDIDISKKRKKEEIAEMEKHAYSTHNKFQKEGEK